MNKYDEYQIVLIYLLKYLTVLRNDIRDPNWHQ